MPASERFGLGVALATPLRKDGSIDLPKLVGHARASLTQGCSVVTVFGSTGEGSSLGIADRHRVLGALAGAGFDMNQVVAGVTASSVEDAVAQSRLAYEAGCRGLLLAPPFYFKGVPDDAVFAWFAQVFETLGAAPGVLLYNIPSLTGVELSVDVIGRLRKAYPKAVAGVKDSSGNWGYSERLLKAHSDLIILIGDERHLARAVTLGGQGAISGLANIYPKALLPLANEGKDDSRIHRIVEALCAYSVIPAVKALIAHQSGDASWANVRPPLGALTAAEVARVGSTCDGILAAKAA